MKKNIGSEKEFWSETVAVLQDIAKTFKGIAKSINDIAEAVAESTADEKVPRSND
jgi:hypothetical protein